MTFNFVEKEFNIGGVGQVPPAFQFYKQGFILGGSVSPTWQDVILSGNTALTLVNAKADGLNYCKLFGGCEQNGTPTPAVPVDIVCNNGVIKYSNNVLPKTASSATPFFVPQSDGGVVCQGTPTGYEELAYSGITNFNPSGTYTFGFKGEVVNARLNVYIREGTTNLDQFTPTPNNPYVTVDMSQYPTAARVQINIARINNNVTMSGTIYPYAVGGSNPMAEYHSYKEVYTDGTKEVVTDDAGNTATATDLLAIDDVKDVQEVLSGNVTRKFKVLVLDGTENWIGQFNQSRVYLLVSDIENKAGRNADIMCTHYKPTSAGGTNYETCFHYTNQLFITPQTTITSTTEWTAYLEQQYANGTPVVIIYPLASAKTETVSAQTLTTQAGTNVIEITQASVNNLPLEVSYKAGVSVTITEVQNANLDNSVTVTIGE